MNTMKKLEEIFRDVFDDETIILTRETTSSDIEDWDSLMQMQLVVTAESIFKIKFSVTEITALKNVGDFFDCIDRKLENK